MGERVATPGSNRFSEFVSAHATLIVVLWLVGAVLIRGSAPDWQSLALDGDFEYLPANMPSVAAERVLDAAFPADRPRSQVVIVIAREDEPLGDADELMSLDLLRRLHHRLAEVLLQRAARATGSPGSGGDVQSERLLALARDSLDEAIRIDEQYFQALRRSSAQNLVAAESIRLTLAYWDRAKLLQRLGENDAADADLQAALILDPDIAQHAPPLDERDLSAWSSLLDLVSWNDAVLGSRLRQPRARLIVVQSTAELAATHNIVFFEAIRGLTADVRQRHQSIAQSGLEILATGSAAIGGETLTAARDSLRYTEWFTVLMVLLILTLVYRSPLLIAVPIVSIGLAVAVSTGVISWLTLGSQEGWLPGLDLRIFTTSRIFVFVILFGAGTDYCLFLIARLREEAAQWPWDVAVSRALAGVSEALLGSALTTVVGLAMLWIARYGKFHYTGPVIAVCLLIGLFVCMTLTPAILRLLGPKVFWPSKVRMDDAAATAIGQRAGTPPSGMWGVIALRLTARPGLALVVGFGLLLLPAGYGWLHEHDVTYDISSQLDSAAESRRGFEMLSTHFGVGEIAPTTVLLIHPEPASEATLIEDAKELTKLLYEVEGVRSVRSADDPLGDRAKSLMRSEAWTRLLLRTHRSARRYFLSEAPQYAGRLVRLDVVMDGDPFDVRTAENVIAMIEAIREQTRQADSRWHHAEVLAAGTTPSIIDLRAVTLQDHRRIKLAVVVAVFAVLMIIIRRLVLCAYLIITVLLSYYATLGLTVLFFRWVYGGDYLGLDWKLPLFLFVILVAVGQDYNVYLVTRIIQEQRQRGGWLSALRRAVARTGGIITACGLVMAGTFASMTASAWLPALQSIFGWSAVDNPATLRGIVELGFALGLGVLLDTFYVRVILVPSFVALLDRARWRSHGGALQADDA